MDVLKLKALRLDGVAPRWWGNDKAVEALKVDAFTEPRIAEGKLRTVGKLRLVVGEVKMKTAASRANRWA